MYEEGICTLYVDCKVWLEKKLCEIFDNARGQSGKRFTHYNIITLDLQENTYDFLIRFIYLGKTAFILHKTAEMTLCIILDTLG